MANNRMAIVCKDCNEGIAIAKFWPQGGIISGNETGWGQYPLSVESMDKFFIKHAHDHDQTSIGEGQYDLRYEDDNTWNYGEKPVHK